MADVLIRGDLAETAPDSVDVEPRLAEVVPNSVQFAPKLRLLQPNQGQIWPVGTGTSPNHCFTPRAPLTHAPMWRHPIGEHGRKHVLRWVYRGREMCSTNARQVVRERSFWKSWTRSKVKKGPEQAPERSRIAPLVAWATCGLRLDCVWTLSWTLLDLEGPNTVKKCFLRTLIGPNLVNIASNSRDIEQLRPKPGQIPDRNIEPSSVRFASELAESCQIWPKACQTLLNSSPILPNASQIAPNLAESGANLAEFEAMRATLLPRLPRSIQN